MQSFFQNDRAARLHDSQSFQRGGDRRQEKSKKTGIHSRNGHNWAINIWEDRLWREAVRASIPEVYGSNIYHDTPDVVLVRQLLTLRETQVPKAFLDDLRVRSDSMDIVIGPVDTGDTL